jgi:predicted aspartyl protease
MNRRKGVNGVDRFTVSLDLANYTDMVKAEQGIIDQSKVRRFTIQGVVDSGANRLVLPPSVVKRLGLQPSGKVKVRYAVRRTGQLDLVDAVYVEIQGRHSIFKAAIAPRRKTALIGAIVLEDLDFLVDCTEQKLVPRDPKYIVSELE